MLILRAYLAGLSCGLILRAYLAGLSCGLILRVREFNSHLAAVENFDTHKKYFCQILFYEISVFIVCSYVLSNRLASACCQSQYGLSLFGRGLEQEGAVVPMDEPGRKKTVEDSQLLSAPQRSCCGRVAKFDDCGGLREGWLFSLCRLQEPV